MNSNLPEGFQIRPPVEADLEKMYVVSQAYELACYGESDFTFEDLRTLWDSPTFDMTEQARLIFNPAGQLIWVAYFNERAYIHYTVQFDVLPGHEDSRIRDYLMELGEAWMRRQMVKAPAQARLYERDWIAAKNVAANEWFRARPDFSEVRRFWEMQIEMQAAPPLPVWPAGITLRPFVAERDTRAVFEADEKFFKDHWGTLPQDYPTWRHWSVERANFDPSLWFLAYVGEQLVGISLCKDGPKGWVDTLGVERSWRGKGLGLALLNHAFGEFYRRGRLTVGLGVDSKNLTGATRLYERAGMHVAHESITYERELRAGVDMSIYALEV